MIFVDSSAYIGILNPLDNNHKKALVLSSLLAEENHVMTSYTVLGEVLTVGSMRYNRLASIDFVKNVFESKTKIVSEDNELIERAFRIFQNIKDKDVGWVDCLSFAIIEHYKIEKVFSFDKDFKKYAKAKIIE